MMSPDIIDEFGEAPGQIGRDIRAYTAAATLLATEYPRLMREHEGEWVAVYRDGIVATAQSLDEVLSELRRRGIPAAKTIVRRIEQRQTILVL